MITVGEINIAPVKSMSLLSAQKVSVDVRGILEDRRFYLIDDRGALLTQRELGQLVQVKSEYQSEAQVLTLRFPEGDTLNARVEPGQRVVTRIWGRRVAGRILEGDWDAALSGFCGMPVRLVASDQPGQCYDEFPISLLSQASLDGLTGRADEAATFEGRRFRPTFLLSGMEPHEEDSWLERSIQIGEQLRLRIVARDPRCSIVTHNPDTGERDIDALRLILGYRPDPRAAYFGVYGIVEQSGQVCVGDEVIVLA